MNTSEVAKLLGVSVSTVKRWVKQLQLPMERNERGHYIFKEEDIGILRQIHNHVQNGLLLQEITEMDDKKRRKGTVKADENDKAIEKLSAKIFDLESRLNAKADSVASYQLLQHRKEIEELHNIIKSLMNRVSKLENQTKTSPIVENPLILDQTDMSPRKPKKKNIVSSLFGF